MTVSPWLVLAGALLGAGLAATLLAVLSSSTNRRGDDEQARVDDQFAQLIAQLEEPQP
ncbi:hypothetical protein P3T27_006529 [Kitasatospora sp. MAA19]|uniref:hypothetical protein n=1 Tax=Kitasatospora sp. MAA19 TaxID=3035090 RepID=UPI002476AD97|nr:hypothetical protein [Kitasatospora sp. MAA19]MDH6709780.1 hypothetical protein [Kitasatospora sp. MAA19]